MQSQRTGTYSQVVLMHQRSGKVREVNCECGCVVMYGDVYLNYVDILFCFALKSEEMPVCVTVIGLLFLGVTVILNECG